MRGVRVCVRACADDIYERHLHWKQARDTVVQGSLAKLKDGCMAICQQVAFCLFVFLYTYICICIRWNVYMYAPDAPEFIFIFVPVCLSSSTFAQRPYPWAECAEADTLDDLPEYLQVCTRPCAFLVYIYGLYMYSVMSTQ